MASRTLTIYVEAGTPRTGIWCNTCLTSARYEVDLYLLSESGPSQFKTIRRCRRCDDDA